MALSVSETFKVTLSAAEQLLVEMINRARLNPLAEAARFGIDLNEELQPGTLDGSPRQVLSPNQSLSVAAEGHGQWMVRANTFSHVGEHGSGPADRMREAGYQFTGSSASGENITYRGSTDTVNLDILMKEEHHRDLFLSSAHRVNMLQDFFREIGVSQESGRFTSDDNTFNVSMVTENFALNGSGVFVTGVVYSDRDNDSFYSIGEGRAGIPVQASGITVQTEAAGGYGIRVAASANVAVTLGGISLQLDLSDGNGKLDLVGRDVLTSVDTVLTGSAGSLTALGAGNINLTGYTGADVLVGNAGNNVFDGAAGMDTVRYDLTRAQATLTQAADGAIMVSSAQGNDTLRNIETLVFTNETVDLTTAFTPVLLAWNTDLAHNGTLMMGGGGADMLYAGGFSAGYAPEESMQMFRLYQATFNRAPDVAGHKNWTWYLFENKGDLSQVTERFMASKEFQNTYNDLDTEAFVDFLYQNILGRAADAEGRAQWISYLDSAARADVLRSFSESREFINSTHADAVRFTQERDVGNWSDDIFRLYTATLDRAPDKIGFESWTSALVEGFGFSEAVAGFVGSREFSARYGELDNNGFVELMYSNVLGRAPDVGGRQHWLNYMANGNSRSVVVEAFVQSRESVTRTAPDVEAWVKAQGVQDVLMGGGGDNVLVGGALSDTFVFNAARESTNRVLDLETWDQVHFEGFGYGSIAAVRSHLQQDGTNVVFADQGINIIFEDMTLGTISDEMIFV